MHLRERTFFQEMFIHRQIQSKKRIKKEQKCQKRDERTNQEKIDDSSSHQTHH
jgi:hypothetical protein